MRLIVLIAGWAIYGLGIAQLVWTAASLASKAWSTWGQVFGLPGKVFSVILFPIAVPVAPLYLGIATQDWRPFWRLLILGTSLGWIAASLGGLVVRAAAVRTPDRPREKDDSTSPGDSPAAACGTLIDKRAPWGVIIKEVAFRGQAPDLRRISDQISALTGLAVSVTESSAEEKAGHHDLHAHLAYECAPEAGLEIHTEPEQPQVIYLHWMLGQLPVLLFATIGALEELGGVPREPLSERERREYVRRFTAAEIEEHRRRLRKQHRLSFLLNLLVLPLTVPYWVVRLILTASRNIRRFLEAAKSFHRRHT